MKLSLFKTEFPIMLAPMAGFTDMTYRSICREHGCDFTFTEMISAKGLKYGGKSADLMETAPNERPCGIQLFGRDPDIMAEMARLICGENKGELALIDINMGCPAPKITGNGEGSALMKEPLTAARVIEAVVKASDLPVSVKFRKGWDSGHVNCVDFARMAEASGAAFVTIHGRTRDQMYSGAADWEVIAEAKAALSIPVIGNGDVTGGSSAIAMRDYTGCDGIMVGRGAQGNPWIFREILAALEDREIPARPNRRGLYEMIVRHAQLSCTYKGEYITVREMRKHLAWYTTGLPHAAALRRQINSMETMEELMEGMKLLLEA